MKENARAYFQNPASTRLSTRRFDAVGQRREKVDPGQFLQAVDTQRIVGPASFRRGDVRKPEFMSDEDVAQTAKKNGTTRAVASMEKAAAMGEDLIFAIGNAPTALIHLYEMIREGKIHPKLVIGVPVGFVNVVQSKELIMQTQAPYIVARGRKGGSNIAACICNALLYMIDNRR